MQNATITIEQNPVQYDNATGNRMSKSDIIVMLADKPCFFQPSRSSRRAFAGSLRDSVKLVPVVTLNDPGEIDIGVGDRATVTWQGISKQYKVGDAFITKGIGFRKWYIELEAIQTPA